MKNLNSQSLEIIKNKKIFFYGLSELAVYAGKGAEHNNLKIEGVFDTTVNIDNEKIENKKYLMKLISCTYNKNIINIINFCKTIK